MIGMAIFARLNLPTAAMIQAVTVVPRLAPMMTPIDSMSVRRPTFTKETTMTVVADEDCRRQVTPKPVATPDARFFVMVAMTWRMR